MQHNLDASMLPSMPSTPDAALWNTTVQSTPGVIGAQEVYRYVDPPLPQTSIYQLKLFVGIRDNVDWPKSNNNSSSNVLVMRCQRSCRSRRR